MGEYVKLKTYMSLANRVKNLERLVFKEPLEETLKKNRVDYEEGVEIIIDLCCNTIGVDKYTVLKSEKEKQKGETPRNRYLVLTRRLCYYFIEKYYPLVTLNSIGKKFGNRHHSTIINAISELKDIMQTDENLEIQVNDLDAILKQRLKNKE